MTRFLKTILCLILILSIFTLPTATSISAENVSHVTLTRSEVESRARAMANMQWTLMSSHKSIYGDYVTIPAHISGASVGSTMTGIPYCWGGFNGLDTNGNWIKYSEAALLNRQTAGNIRTRDDNGNSIGHQTKTIGVDCSGFVSSAYGLTSRQSARGLANNYGNPIQYNQLRPMDFICKSGVHVVLYLSQYTDSNGNIMYNIIDSSIEMGKVAIRAVPKSYYTSNGYSCYTPWNPECTYEYSFTAGYHYQKCTDCGYKLTSEPHDFRSINNRYVCNDCGYTTSNLPEINSTDNEAVE